MSNNDVQITAGRTRAGTARRSRWTTAVIVAALALGGAVAVATEAPAAARLAPAATVSAALPAGVPFTTLQFNLCNSGVASCYSRNNGRSVGEAAGIISARRPDVVTLNEVCKADVVTTLAATMAQTFPGQQTFAQFKAAGNRSSGGQPYKCKNGDDYGIGVLGRVPGGPVSTTVYSGLYPQRDTSSNEMRAWICVAAGDVYAACTTHLVSNSGTIALQQCKQLMNTEVPAIRAAVGTAVPVVVAGDLNLKYGGSPNAQSCVPSGWYRKGDGDVQHYLATSNLVFKSSASVSMRYTDHVGWQVTAQP
jgi:endonuclease/exonuclease/phosphatase family protein